MIDGLNKLGFCFKVECKLVNLVHLWKHSTLQEQQHTTYFKLSLENPQLTVVVMKAKNLQT